MDDLHKPLLELRQQHRPTRPDAAAAADDDDNDDADNSQLKHFDDAVFGFLREAAAHRVFSPCAEVDRFIF